MCDKPEFRLRPYGGIEELAGHIWIFHKTWVKDIMGSSVSRKKKEVELLECHRTLHREPTWIDQLNLIPHYHVDKNGERIS